MSEIIVKPVEWKMPVTITHIKHMSRAATEGCPCGACDEIDQRRKTEKCNECFQPIFNCYCK